MAGLFVKLVEVYIEQYSDRIRCSGSVEYSKLDRADVVLHVGAERVLVVGLNLELGLLASMSGNLDSRSVKSVENSI